MEIRVLRYFLAVVREESITRAAEVLHITQPTLSRQLAQMEEDLGLKLFARGTRRISLTEDGLLLRRRAEEILELVDKTEKELAAQDETVEGVVSIGCGDVAAVQLIPALIREFNRHFPLVSFELYTATADHVRERMDRGLTDMGILLEPITIDKYDFVRLPVREEWVVVMHPDSPLADKDAVTAEDLKDVPLIMPHRLSVQSELASWFGDDYNRLHVLFTSNLPSNSSIMVHNRLAYSLSIKGSVSFWDQTKITYRPLSPELRTTSVLAWKRQQPFGVAAEKFIEYAGNYFGRK